jgi:transcription elongation factor Elf1
MTQTIAEIFVPENMHWGAMIECSQCGQSGMMYGTHEPHEERQYWECKDCGEHTKHNIAFKTDSVEVLEDALAE